MRIASDTYTTYASSTMSRHSVQKLCYTGMPRMSAEVVFFHLLVTIYGYMDLIPAGTEQASGQAWTTARDYWTDVFQNIG